MGTEQPDTGAMHRLFDDALDDVDLTENVVPAVLAGYERKVKVRRYQSAGIALAVLATAGAAISALPRGGAAGSASPAASGAQSVDYCKHHQWTPAAADGAKTLHVDLPVFHTNCEALRTALQSVFPDAELVPLFNRNLALDPRVDQTLLKKIQQKTDTTTSVDDAEKYFGAELDYLADHPEDPANVYVPDHYTLITPAGPEGVGVGLPEGKFNPQYPSTFVGSAGSSDCTKMPASLKNSVQCTPVGVADGWHGALWTTSPLGDHHGQLTAVLTDGHGKNIELFASGGDEQGWSPRGATATSTPDSWINHWTGQTCKGPKPPDSHALTDKQWIQFLGSPGAQKFATVYTGTAEVPGRN